MSSAFCVQVFLYCVSVVFSIVAANEESVSINKPIMKTSKRWHFSSDYVRCFCNLPSCVTTGYMCKSSGGGCFSEVAGYPINVYKGRHGCLELLDDHDQQTRCHKRGGSKDRTTIRRKENPKSLLMCCHHDMCNHVENPQTKNLINETLLDDVTQDSADRYQQQDTFLYSDSDVWFRAATIAVPICGAVILFVLIVLAVKILKNEHENSTLQKLGPAMYVHTMPQQSKNPKDRCNHDTYDRLLSKGYVPTHHNNILYPNPRQEYQRQVQVPLLLQNDTCNKNHMNARYNLMGPNASIVLDIEKNQDVNVVNGNQFTGGEGKICAGKTFTS